MKQNEVPFSSCSFRDKFKQNHALMPYLRIFWKNSLIYKLLIMFPKAWNSIENKTHNNFLHELF